MRISWRRGFFQVWIVLAVVWVGAASWLVYDSIKPNYFAQFDVDASVDATLIAEFNAHPTNLYRVSDDTLMALYRQVLRENSGGDRGGSVEDLPDYVSPEERAAQQLGANCRSIEDQPPYVDEPPYVLFEKRPPPPRKKPPAVHAPPPAPVVDTPVTDRFGGVAALTAHRFMRHSAVIFIPPLVLLVTGWLLGWIIRGFRHAT